MKKITAITTNLFLIASTLFGQKIEIGQDADEIQSIIISSTDDHDQVDSFGYTSNSYWTWDVEYYNDQLTAVIQCYNDQYLAGLGTITYYCKFYKMQNGLLAYTLTQFEDVSLERLNKYFEDSYGNYKFGDLFFSEDFTHYSKICEDDKGIASVEWWKTDLNELPPDLKAVIENKIKERQDTIQIKKGEEEVKKQDETALKSKTYDLEIQDTAAYNLFINDLRQSLIEELKYNYSFLDWDQIENSNQNYFIFKNSYSALFRLVNYGEEIPDDGDMLREVNYDIRSENYFVHLSGEDSTCSLLNASPNLPTINYQGYYVMTDASVRDINVFYVKGITQVNIQNGVVTYIRYPPPAEVQEPVSQKIKTLKNGKYIIKYETGQVMGEPFTTTEKEKMVTVAGKILRVTGLIIILTLSLIVSGS